MTVKPERYCPVLSCAGEILQGTVGDYVLLAVDLRVQYGIFLDPSPVSLVVLINKTRRREWEKSKTVRRGSEKTNGCSGRSAGLTRNMIF